MTAAPASRDVDVAIVGGGLVGASLALALAGTGLGVLLAEAVPFDDQAQPSFDERTTALGNGSRRILETLGVWPAIAAAAAPIRNIHVSDAGRPAIAHLDAAELGLDAFGHVVSNRVLGHALWQSLDVRAGGAGARGLGLLAPVRLTDVRQEAEAVQLGFTAATGEARRCRARLVVAADGADSLVRQAAGIAADVADYQQVAITTRFRATRPAEGIAYERFTPEGPLAVLPLADGRYGLVWTRSTGDAPATLALDDAAFVAQLQRQLGWRLGEVREVAPRASYPLRLSRAARLAGLRTVLIGNAAQALHPVAGQGFNLGLRDAAVLADVLVEADDPGSAATLERFAAQRSRDRAGMIGFTDGLVRGFGSQRPLLSALRSLGLLLFEQLPSAKRGLSRLSWGFGADAPRLMRGLPVLARGAQRTRRAS